jgi:hypothetical protein
MRWLGILALLGACGSKDAPPPVAGQVALRLAMPHGVLDPSGFTSVDVVLHIPGQADDERSATIDKTGGASTFKLGTIEPIAGVQIEATLRNSSGAAVGYGRTAIGETIGDGAEISVPVRRPIAYVAGAVSRALNSNQPNVLTWSEAPATFSDLSAGTPLDGTTQIGSQAVLLVSAGPNLYMITQAVTAATGALTGPAMVTPISTADHKVGTALTGQMTGAVLDGAGADDGSKLAIATASQLFAVDTATGAVTALADGSFARVAIVMTDTGELAAVAIKNRGSTTTGPCSTAAELWWAPLSGGAAAAHLVARGGFSDLATDRGHAYYVDACTGQLGEVTAAAAQMLTSITGKPTALAVSNGQAFIGVESQPATTSLLIASLAPGDPPRTLWTETAQQVMEAADFPGVQRQLAAVSVVFDHLEVGAGGDYVALTTSGHFHGAAVPDANFPDITIDSEELRVFDASTGGVVQRYRSWCQGAILFLLSDIFPWKCALAPGQTAAANMSMYDHHINSMTFLFGKK